MTDPNVTPQEFKRLKEQVTARMIQILTEEQGYTLEAQRGLAPLRPIPPHACPLRRAGIC